MTEENLLQRLAARDAPVMRLPAPPPPEDDMDMAEKHTFSGDDLARMATRMARTLRKLGLPAEGGGRLALAQPVHTLEWLMLWLGAVQAGHEVLLLAADDELPEDVQALVCPPAAKTAWQPLARQRGAKLATLGGHWEGSLFMLQMVQPNEAQGLFDAGAGRTRFADGAELALDDLLALAETFANDHALVETPALLASLAALREPRGLAAALATLLTDAPLYWIAPHARQQALKELPEVPTGSVVLGDAEFIAAQRWEHMVPVET